MATAPAAPTPPPPDGTAFPPPPSTNDPDNFDPRADAAFAAMGPLQTEFQAVKANVHANAQSAYDSALDAQASKTAAAASEANANASANFKGAWSALTGPLAMPASVLHSGAYWNLLNPLADVTTSEPGVSADWSEAGVTSVNGMRGAVVIESSVADSLYLNNLAGAF